MTTGWCGYGGRSMDDVWMMLLQSSWYSEGAKSPLAHLSQSLWTHDVMCCACHTTKRCVCASQKSLTFLPTFGTCLRKQKMEKIAKQIFKVHYQINFQGMSLSQIGFHPSPSPLPLKSLMLGSWKNA